MSSYVVNEQSPQVKVARAWAASINAKDFIAVGNLLSDKSFVHEVLPKSLDFPLMNKDEWVKFQLNTKEVFGEIHVSF